MSKQDELRVRAEHRFLYRGFLFTMRHYNDGAWELLDEKELPICQGFCADEGSIDTTDCE